MSIAETQRSEGIWATESIGGVLGQELSQALAPLMEPNRRVLEPWAGGDPIGDAIQPPSRCPNTAYQTPCPNTAYQKSPFVEHLLSAQWILACI